MKEAVGGRSEVPKRFFHEMSEGEKFLRWNGNVSLEKRGRPAKGRTRRKNF